MDTLFQEATLRTSSPWEGSGANTPALAAEVDDRGNVEYKVRPSYSFFDEVLIVLVESGELLPRTNRAFGHTVAMAVGGRERRSSV